MIQEKASSSNSSSDSIDAEGAAETGLTLTKHVTYKDPYGPKEPLIFGGKSLRSLITRSYYLFTRILCTLAMDCTVQCC